MATEKLTLLTMGAATAFTIYKLSAATAFTVHKLRDYMLSQMDVTSQMNASIQNPVNNPIIQMEKKEMEKKETYTSESSQQSSQEPVSQEPMGILQIDDSGPNSEIQISVVPHRRYGVPRLSNFKVVACNIPELKEGEILVKTLFISVDPYLRSRIGMLKVGDVPTSGNVARVLESRAEGIEVGDNIFEYLPWRKVNVYKPTLGKSNSTFRKISKDLPCSTALGVAGMPGFTAYVGLLQAAEFKQEDNTVFVSGAAGAVGSAVGQIAKLKNKGCRVVGTCGSAAKCAYLKKIGFDVAINYKECKTADAMRLAIQTACPEGIDVYFDNTGGHTTDAVMSHLKKYARVAVCGQIANYNATKTPMCEAFLMQTIYKCITIRGFIVYEYNQKWETFIKEMTEWIQNGKLSYKETIEEGFNNVPRAFIGLFSGKNTGKMIIKV